MAKQAPPKKAKGGKAPPFTKKDAPGKGGKDKGDDKNLPPWLKKKG